MQTPLIWFGASRGELQHGFVSSAPYVKHVSKVDYEKATMNMAKDIKEVKNMIRKNTGCATTTRFSTLLPSAKKVRIAAPAQLAVATHVDAR